MDHVHGDHYDQLSPMFLSPLLRDANRRWLLANADTGGVLARQVHAAFDSASRRRGLLGRAGLEDEALIIAPCSAVHTFFMQFPIDVVFAARDGRITRTWAAVKPWRLAAALRGFAAIELQAGTLARTGTHRGHRLELRPLLPDAEADLQVRPSQS
jgi:uncharacterized membrane protein (UPF0127 family)